MYRPQTTLAFLALLAVPACLYDGSGTRGLPCNIDNDCGAQMCIEKVCGGPDARDDDAFDDEGEESDDGEDEDDDDDENDDASEVTEQEFDPPCTPGVQTCIGDNAIEWCGDDEKLRRARCEAACGPEVEPLGCWTQDGNDYCFCDN